MHILLYALLILAALLFVLIIIRVPVSQKAINLILLGLAVAVLLWQTGLAR